MPMRFTAKGIIHSLQKKIATCGTTRSLGLRLLGPKLLARLRLSCRIAAEGKEWSYELAQKAKKTE